MAFTLNIRATRQYEHFSFGELLENCGFSFGHDNEFHILQEGMENRTAILYNPDCIGRGIFFDARNIDDNAEIVISYNIPTTRAEIEDFVGLAREIERQFEEVEMFCVEEERTYTTVELCQNIEAMVEFSRTSLNSFCSNKEYTAKMLTLAKWPITLPEELVEEFAACEDLDEFEDFIHDKQDMDVYYGKPRLYENKNGGILAVYTLTEECESIFPTKADGFLNLDGIKVTDGVIQFYIYSEDRVVDGLFDYEKFVEYVLENGAEYYDPDHILVPEMTKDEIEKMARAVPVGI